MSARLGGLSAGGVAFGLCLWSGIALGQVPLETAPAARMADTTGNHGSTPHVVSSEYPYLISDPLNARPRVLDTGASLPGELVSPTCPTSVDVSHPLTLLETVDVALCANPQVQEAWAAVKIQAAGVGEARASWLPVANATVSQLSNRTDYPGIPVANTKTSGHTVYASLTWRLVDFGQRAASDEAASQSLAAALASHDAALQKALNSVVQAYFDALTARAGVEVRHEATQFAQLTLDATIRRENAGAAPVSDTLQARAALAKAKLAEQRSIGDYHKALSVLIYKTGLPVDGRLTLAAEAATPQEAAVSDLENWIAEATTAHPAIAAARAQLRSAEANVDVVRAQGMPTIDFSGNYYQNGYPNQGLQPTRSSTTTVGVTLTIPIFDGFARTYQARRAQAQVEQSRAQLQGTQLEILTTVVKDHADAMATLANLGSSSDWLNAASESVASAQRRYEKGAGDVLELISAQAALGDAKLERARCVSEWRAARLRLLADVGRLGRVDLTREDTQ
jgi:outer membrane protein